MVYAGNIRPGYSSQSGKPPDMVSALQTYGGLSTPQFAALELALL